MGHPHSTGVKPPWESAPPEERRRKVFVSIIAPAAFVTW